MFLEKKEKRREKRILDEIFNKSVEGYLILDKGLNLVEMNRKFEQITGYNEEEIERGGINFMNSKTGVKFSEILRDLTGYRWQGMIQIKTKDEKKKSKEMAIKKIELEGSEKENYYLITIYQTSDPKEMDEEDRKIQKKNYEKKYLKHILSYDGLTGFANEILFKKEFQNLILESSHQQRKGLLILLKIETLKELNDSLGYQAKNQLLIELAYRLKEGTRKYCRDYMRNCTIGMINGNQFVIGFGQIRNRDEAEEITINLIQKTKDSPFMTKGYQIPIHLHVGLSIFPDDGNYEELLLQNAYNALGCIKNSNEKIYQFYTQNLREEKKQFLDLHQELREGLKRENFIVHYQPRYDLNKEHITSVEGLVRLKSERRGLIFPNDFIPYAERSGLIREIGEKVLRIGCQENKSWQEKGYQKVRVAINVSAKQFQEKDFEEIVKKVLIESGLESIYLELELTESVMLQNIQQTIETLKNLERMGIYVSIDDFGIKYSSLNYLKKLPVKALKLDRSFIKSLPDEMNSQIMAKLIIDLGHSMDLNVIAEGVEKKDQIEFLKANDCDEAQGYYLSKPLSKEKMDKLLEERSKRNGKRG